MKKKFSLLALCVFILVSTLKAQNDYREGFIVTNKQDTVYGLVKYQSNLSNYKKCIFKKDGKLKEYSPSEIKGFGYQNFKHYTSGITKNRFAELIIDGCLSLYKAKDMYIIKKEGEKYELETEDIWVEIDDKRKIKKDNRWKGILFVHVNDCINRNHKAYSQLEFTEKSISKLVEEYNKCKKKDYRNIKNNRKWLKTELGISLGIEQNTLSVNGINNVYQDAKNTFHTFTPKYGIAIRLSSPRTSEYLGIETGLYYNRNEFSELIVEEHLSYQTIYHNLTVKMSSFNIPVNLKIEKPVKSFSVFLKAGISINLHLNTEAQEVTETVYNNTVIRDESNPFSIHNKQIGFNGGLGLYKSFPNFSTSLSFGYDRLPNPGEAEGLSQKISLNLIIFNK